MAEEETVNQRVTVKDNANSLWHKFKVFAFQTLTIVFAVTLAIQLYSWNEYNAEQKQVKAFLVGLKQDILGDIRNIKYARTGYKSLDTLYTYLSSLKKTQKPNLDSLKLLVPSINSNITFKDHKTRFNGFFSAGKIMTIEDDSLYLQILSYYQETVPGLKSSETAWHVLNRNLNEYIQDNLKDDSQMAYWKVLTTPKASYLAKRLIPWEQLLERHEKVIEEGEEIIKRIDKLYPDSK